MCEAWTLIEKGIRKDTLKIRSKKKTSGPQIVPLRPTCRTNSRRDSAFAVELAVRITLTGESFMDRQDEPQLLGLRRMTVRVGVTQKWLKEAAESARVPGLYADGCWLFDSVTVTKAIVAMANARHSANRADVSPAAEVSK